MDLRYCSECRIVISFDDFCRDNPSLSESTAKKFYSNDLFAIYCPDCFYHLPERPFKIRMGLHRSYFSKIRYKINEK
jgi:hypothetical protein